VENASFVSWLQNAFVWVFGFLCDIELIYWSPHMCCVRLGWDTWQWLPILSRNNCCGSGPAETFFKRSLLPLVRPVTMSYDSVVTSSTFSEGLILMVDRCAQHTQPRNNVLLSIVRHCGVILVMTLAFCGTRSGLRYSSMRAGGTPYSAKLFWIKFLTSCSSVVRMLMRHRSILSVSRLKSAVTRG
jgi:hypothetical protein